MNISDILRYKSAHNGGDVVTISASDTVTELLARLAEHNLGALIVVDAGSDAHHVAGIVSERDIVRRLSEHGSDLLERTVGDIMTTSVLSCASGDTVDSIAETMTARRVRHMPVIDGGALTGIVSIGDVVSIRMRQLEHDRGQLEQYISS